MLCLLTPCFMLRDNVKHKCTTTGITNFASLAVTIICCIELLVETSGKSEIGFLDLPLEVRNGDAQRKFVVALKYKGTTRTRGRHDDGISSNAGRDSFN